jgi:hypothetical protein
MIRSDASTNVSIIGARCNLADGYPGRPQEPCCPDNCRNQTCTASTSGAPSSSGLSSASETTIVSTVTEHHTASSDVSSTPTPASSTSATSLSGGKLAGIIVGCIAGTLLAFLMVGMLFRKRRRRSTITGNNEQHARSSTSNSQDLRFPSAGVKPGVRGMWAPPNRPSSPIAVATAATPLNPNAPLSPSKPSTRNVSSPASGYIKPFFLREDRTTRSPAPATSPTDQEEDTLVSGSASSVHEVSPPAMIKTSGDVEHGIDPNGSEAYEMTRWGKSITQTNVE